jgi:hypothetical protein
MGIFRTAAHPRIRRARRRWSSFAGATRTTTLRVVLCCGVLDRGLFCFRTNGVPSLVGAPCAIYEC